MSRSVNRSLQVYDGAVKSIKNVFRDTRRGRNGPTRVRNF